MLNTIAEIARLAARLCIPKSGRIERGGHPSEQDIDVSKLPKLPSGPGPGSDVGMTNWPRQNGKTVISEHINALQARIAELERQRRKAAQ